jgi:DNA-binding NtrC family response regulator
MEPLKILIVDDENVVRETLIAMMEHFGHTTDWVSDGVTGKEVMMNNQYDVAFVDLRMPGIDGMSLLRWSKEVQLNLPIIIMTGHGDTDARDDALQSGAFSFLNKPFSLKETKHLLKEIQSREG